MQMVLFNFLHRRRVLIFSIAVVLLCLVAFAFIQGDVLMGKTDLLTMQTAFSVEKMESILTEWGDDGVAVYLRMMWADFFFPASYGIALASAITLLATPREKTPDRTVLVVMLLPLIAGVCDLVENVFHLLAACFASVKWFLLFFSALSVVAYSFVTFRRHQQN